MEERVKIIGIYPVEGNENVHFFEVIVQETAWTIDISEFMQEDPSQPKENWQVAYDEYYLDAKGERVTGDSLNLPETNTTPSRIGFFLYFVNLNRPLLTPFGKVNLPQPTLMPERLKAIITFEEVD